MSEVDPTTPPLTPEALSNSLSSMLMSDEAGYYAEDETFHYTGRTPDGFDFEVSNHARYVLDQPGHGEEEHYRALERGDAALSLHVGIGRVALAQYLVVRPTALATSPDNRFSNRIRTGMGLGPGDPAPSEHVVYNVTEDRIVDPAEVDDLKGVHQHVTEVLREDHERGLELGHEPENLSAQTPTPGKDASSPRPPGQNKETPPPSPTRDAPPLDEFGSHSNPASKAPSSTIPELSTSALGSELRANVNLVSPLEIDPEATVQAYKGQDELQTAEAMAKDKAVEVLREQQRQSQIPGLGQEQIQAIEPPGHSR